MMSIERLLSNTGTQCVFLKHTVDGRNPEPVDRWFIPLFTWFYTSQMVQDFLHQQYLTYSARKQILTMISMTLGESDPTYTEI